MCHVSDVKAWSLPGTDTTTYSGVTCWPNACTPRWPATRYRYHDQPYRLRVSPIGRDIVVHQVTFEPIGTHAPQISTDQKSQGKKQKPANKRCCNHNLQRHQSTFMSSARKEATFCRPRFDMKPVAPLHKHPRAARHPMGLHVEMRSLFGTRLLLHEITIYSWPVFRTQHQPLRVQALRIVWKTLNIAGQATELSHVCIDEGKARQSVGPKLEQLGIRLPVLWRFHCEFWTRRM